MTAPTARLSPTAGLFNALVRLAIQRHRARITELRRQMADARELNHALQTAAGYRASERAGYIDRTGLE